MWKLNDERGNNKAGRVLKCAQKKDTIGKQLLPYFQRQKAHIFTIQDFAFQFETDTFELSVSGDLL